MKKSTIAGIFAFLAVVGGALTAAYVYLRRREKELDEYEKLLFSEEFAQEYRMGECEDEAACAQCMEETFQDQESAE